MVREVDVDDVYVRRCSGVARNCEWGFDTVPETSLLFYFSSFPFAVCPADGGGGGGVRG